MGWSGTPRRSAISRSPRPKISLPPAKRRILAFRHVPFEPLGLLQPVLAERNIVFEYVDLPSDPERNVDIASASGLIFMGGPMSVNDDLPFIRRELIRISDAAARGTPLLGLCLGSQLIAKALGAKVYPNGVKEIGWAPVTWTAAASRDPLLRGLSAPEQMFHWHGDTFDLPRGAELLASSEVCRHQAFRVGRNIYGLQFHLEVTPGMIADWCTEDTNCGSLREVTTPIDPFAHAARMRELSFLVFDRWCELLN